MTVTGPLAKAAGFDVRVPALSRRKPSPALRLETIASDPSVVGAHQLAQVRWSAVFDDVELTAAEIAKLASQARPLIRSHGKWVEVDRADLAEAAAALAERADADPADRRRDAALRHRPRGVAARRRLQRRRHRLGRRPARPGRAALDRARSPRPRASRASCAATRARPSPGSASSTRSSSAAAWRSTWASARRRRCWPTSPARPAHGPALVVAPPAVVGNWAAEAARFTPGLKVVVHHGASRASADELGAEVADADVVITTYGTAVRDVEAISALPWDRLVLDEAQAIKNSANETAQQLRRIPARVRLALDRHADRERPRRPVVDPRLHQPRPGRLPHARSSPQLSAGATTPDRVPRRRCGRSTASSCSAAPSPSRSSPPSCPSASTSSTTAR